MERSEPRDDEADKQLIGNDLSHATINECHAKHCGFGGANLSHAILNNGDLADLQEEELNSGIDALFETTVSGYGLDQDVFNDIIGPRIYMGRVDCSIDRLI
ncbi:MAG: hypothetical protein CSA29_03050 [Desulfobacterales bacterium]|nr:MAG: hypothetical protein CSA29_03050 [Desulfobacterales bacterium]